MSGSIHLVGFSPVSDVLQFSHSNGICKYTFCIQRTYSFFFFFLRDWERGWWGGKVAEGEGERESLAGSTHTQHRTRLGFSQPWDPNLSQNPESDAQMNDPPRRPTENLFCPYTWYLLWSTEWQQYSLYNFKDNSEFWCQKKMESIQLALWWNISFHIKT